MINIVGFFRQYLFHQRTYRRTPWTARALGQCKVSIHSLHSCVLVALVVVAGCTTRVVGVKNLIPPGPTAEAPALPLSCLDYRQGVRIDFFDVGQGDAALITCPDGQTQTLIDAGDADWRYPKAHQKFLQALRVALHGDRVVEFGINTHPDPDHVEGFLSLAIPSPQREISLAVFFDNGLDNPDSMTEETIRHALGEGYINLSAEGLHRIPICPLSATTVAGPELQLYFPDDSASGQQLHCPGNLNDCGIVIRLVYGDTSLLFLADTTYTWETYLLENSQMDVMFPSSSATRVSIATLGHHGSQSMTEEFLNALAAKAFVVSSGSPGVATTEQFGYPERDVIERVVEVLESSSPMGTDQLSAVPTCERNTDGRCRWQTTNRHPLLYSTNIDGTITAWSSGQSICLSAAHRADEQIIQ